MCVICGNLGCGRYKLKHAQNHFQEVNHSLSMEISTDRIWDYMGDNFVHRIIKNKNYVIVNLPDSLGTQQQQQQAESVSQSIDNQLVAASEQQDKAIWEYCYILSHQMEEQRKFFEQKIEEERHLLEENEAIKDKQRQIKELDEQMKQMRGKIAAQNKECDSLAKKNKQLKDKSGKIEQEISQLEIFARSMADNLKLYQSQSTTNSQDNLDSSLLLQIKQQEQLLQELNKKKELMYMQLQ